MDTVFEILYVIFCISLVIWICYDIINVIVKKKTYNAVEAEVWQHEYVPRQSRDDSPTYKIRLKYMYEGKENFYSTKWSSNFFIPKVGTKRNIYINPNKTSKIFFIEPKMFIFFILFRLVFIILLIKKLIINYKNVN